VEKDQAKKGADYTRHAGPILETQKHDGITYILRKIPCGKKRCLSCPHGPYWYARFTKGGVARQIYLGKPPFKTLNEFNLIKKMQREEKKDGRKTK